MLRCSLKILFLATLQLAFTAGVTSSVLAQVVPDAVIEGDDAFLQLGESISCVGKLAIIGAPGRSFGSFPFNVGEVLFYDPVSNFSSVVSSPDSNSDVRFGTSVAILSDVSNDGEPDFIAGGPGPMASQGGAYLYHTVNLTTPQFSISGSQTSEKFGAAVAALPDIDGDGRQDWIIGSPNKSVSDGGFQIESSVNAFVSMVSGATASSDALGSAFAPLGDLSGDGTPDLLVGAPGVDGSDGKVFIYSLAVGPPMQPPPTEIAVLPLVPLTSAEFGSAVANAGDLNSDGFDDIAVGAPNFSANRGLVRVYSGAGISVSPQILCDLVGAQVQDFLGTSLTGLGDINGDGVPEFAAGAPGANSNTGEVRIYSYVGGSCVLERTIPGSVVNQSFGIRLAGLSVAGRCDIDNDGLTDLAVSTQSDLNGTDAGSVQFYAKVLPTVTPTATPTPTPTATPTATATVTPTPTATPAISPSRAKLGFRISESGVFRLSIDYNQEPSAGCSATLFGRVQVGGNVDRLERIHDFKFSDTSIEQTTVFQFTNVPRAMLVNGSKPVINMVVRTQCGASIIDSNVFARYMNCGVPDTSVTTTEWIATLKAGFRQAVASSIRSGRTVYATRLRHKKRKKRSPA